MAAYLTQAEYAARTSTLEADAPSNLDLRLASEAVDAYRPFIGDKLLEDQAREFPRTWVRPGDTAEVVPESVLDAVVLIAALEASPEQVVSVSAESDLDTSVQYSRPVIPDAMRRAQILLSPYQKRNGRML